jgi:hypothetical protein
MIKPWIKHEPLRHDQEWYFFFLKIVVKAGGLFRARRARACGARAHVRNIPSFVPTNSTV